tara:strand:- start:6149 stop:6940 length:792 start_codon:yes stop_codon:yes gene_type:complete
MTNKLRYSYIIGSGWWCGENQKSENRVIFGDDSIRGKDFHKLWYESVCKYTNPEKIIIIDSNSPIKPDLYKGDARIEFLSFPLNAGHSTDHKGKYSGWMRSILLGLEYAYLSDTEYFVYVEQDALLFGNNIVEKCIDKMTKPYMFGSGLGTKQPLQQSFFIIRRDGMEKFIKRIQNISALDSKYSPEMKFTSACTLLWYYMPEFLFDIRGFWRLVKLYTNCNYLPIGYGRKRPIDFNDDLFYFQHGNKDELDQYFKLVSETHN